MTLLHFRNMCNIPFLKAIRSSKVYIPSKLICQTLNKWPSTNWQATTPLWFYIYESRWRFRWLRVSLEESHQLIQKYAANINKSEPVNIFFYAVRPTGTAYQETCTTTAVERGAFNCASQKTRQMAWKQNFC